MTTEGYFHRFKGGVSVANAGSMVPYEEYEWREGDKGMGWGWGGTPKKLIKGLGLSHGWIGLNGFHTTCAKIFWN